MSSVPDFAIVGMAGMLGGTTGAAMTAIVMVFELTRDYNVIVPMILCVTLAIAVRRALLPQSIYTLKLADKGHEVPDALQANMFRIRPAERVDVDRFRDAAGRSAVDETIASLVETGRPLYLMIADGKRLKGYLRLDPGFKLWQPRAAGHDARRLARTDFVLTRPADTMFDVIGRLARRGARLAIVVAAKARAARRRCAGYHRARDHGRGGDRQCARLCAAARTRNPFPLLYRRRASPGRSGGARRGEAARERTRPDRRYRASGPPP